MFSFKLLNVTKSFLFYFILSKGFSKNKLIIFLAATKTICRVPKVD